MYLPLADLPELVVLTVAVMLLVLFLILLGVIALLVRPWLRAAFSGEPVELFNILGMRLRGNPPNLLIDAYIVLKKRGVDITIGEIEGTYIDAKTRIFNFDDLVDVVESRKASESRRET